MSYETFKQGDVAEATLRIIYEVMQAAEPYYPGEPWRKQTMEEHARCAHLHAMRAFENLHSKEDGKGANTGKPDWHHALTRYAFMAALSANRVDPSAVVVDSVEDEVAGE